MVTGINAYRGAVIQRRRKAQAYEDMEHEVNRLRDEYARRYMQYHTDEDRIQYQCYDNMCKMFKSYGTLIENIITK